MILNTVVILNAGIGAMSLGFAEAGFQIAAAFEQDKKAVALYKRNINDKIYECDLLKLTTNEIPDADVIAADLMHISLFQRIEQNRANKSWTGDEHLIKVYKIVKEKNPPAFCFVMRKTAYRSPSFAEFLEELSGLNYHVAWEVINTKEVTGFPVTEGHLYIIGSRTPDICTQFPEKLSEHAFSFEDFVSDTTEDDRYYRLYDENIQANSEKNCFFCWTKDKYAECPNVGWNWMKPPLVRVDGQIRKLTHREIARLKGFPENFEFNLSNKSWLFRALIYSPNVQEIRRVAECLNHSRGTPLWKMQALTDRKFEQLFGEYLKQRGGEIKKEVSDGAEADFAYTYEGTDVYFNLKFYNRDFLMKQNLQKLCRRLSEEADGTRRILVVANLVPDEIKESCKAEFGVFIWDIRNLLWIFEEFPIIKNEFIALLNYSVESIEPEKPIPSVFDHSEEKSEEYSLKDKLQKVKPGQEQYQQYEDVCIEILKYVLGDYLTLWYVQEKTDNGMYRFDLCCKIKNGTNQDFFHTVQQYFNTKYIVFEFKNYSEQITQKEIYTTEKYLYEKALRRVAVIISRKGADENALAAARGSLRETGKLILCLSDKDMMDLIDIKDKNEQSTGNFFEAMLDDLLIHLEK